MLTDRKRQSAASHYKKIMQIMGINLNDEHSKDTPLRVVKALEEQTESLREPKEFKLTTFKNTGDQLVIVVPIPFSSLCAHHHAPFIGHAAVGYLPDKHMVGISKFKRVIDHFASMPQTQEVLVNQIADYLHKALSPKAVYVYMEAHHACMGARGIRTPCSNTITHAVRGKEALKHELKSEFVTFINGRIPRGYV